MTKCVECGGDVPANRFNTCSPKCYEKWAPKFFAALEELSKRLPKVKLHL